jgi:hypothetical protein
LTCIVGAVDKTTGDIYLGGDSSAVSEYDMLTIAQPKVMIKGQYAFGFAGHFRFGQILRSVFQPPVYHGECPVDDWLTGEFSEHLRHTLKVLGFSKNKEGREEGGIALVGFQGRLFMMQDEFDFCETRDGYAAIGVGERYALGAIKAMSPDLGGEQMVRKALEISEFYSGGVRSPFHIVKLGLTDGQPEQARKRNTRRNKPSKAGKSSRGAKRGS